MFSSSLLISLNHLTLYLPIYCLDALWMSFLWDSIPLTSSMFLFCFFPILLRCPHHFILLCHHHHHHDEQLYSPRWALASLSKCRQRLPSWAAVDQILQPPDLLMYLTISPPVTSFHNTKVSINMNGFTKPKLGSTATQKLLQR